MTVTIILNYTLRVCNKNSHAAEQILAGSGSEACFLFFFCENTHLNVLAAFETNVEYPDKAKGYANVFCCMFFSMEIRIQLVLLCHKSGRERGRASEKPQREIQSEQ